MSEAKPCPFCGGETDIGEWNDKTFTPRCYKCRAFLDDSFETKQAAISAWNTRYERTTKVEHSYSEICGFNLSMKCLACGTGTVEASANYCQNCGAKVVDQ